MRVVFFGTPEFAVTSLHELMGSGYDVVAVVTQPDKPHGRSRSRLVAPPVKVAGLEYELPVLQPERPTGDLFGASLRRLKPDIGVVVAYGHILRQAILDLPPLGMVNVHASLLPRWRGAAPIQHAILQGDPVTGVSIMRMDAGMDTGPVIHRAETPIGPTETAGELAPRLANLGAEALTLALTAIEEDAAHFEIQDESLATMAPKVTRAGARIDWNADAPGVARQTRAFDPAPGAWSEFGDSSLKMFRGQPVAGAGRPGTILATAGPLTVACGSGAVSITEVQPAGKRRQPAADWIRGRGDLTGRAFE